MPVVVDVGRHHSERLARMPGDSRFPADVGEAAVAVIAKEVTGRGIEECRQAVVGPLSQAVEATPAEGPVVADEAADEQVQAPVSVVIEPDPAGGPAGSQDAGRLGHVREASIPVVPIEIVGPVVGDVEVLPAVAIVVGDHDAHAESPPRNARFIGDVGEGPIPAVAIEGVPERSGWSIKIRAPAVDQVQVHPSVVVVVEERAAGTHRLRQVPASGHGILMDPTDAAVLRRDLLENDTGPGRFFARPGLGREKEEAENRHSQPKATHPNSGRLPVCSSCSPLPDHLSIPEKRTQWPGLDGSRPSWMVMIRSAARPERVCRRPLGQRISTRSTLSARPRPKCSRKSE